MTAVKVMHTASVRKGLIQNTACEQNEVRTISAIK